MTRLITAETSVVQWPLFYFFFDIKMKIRSKKLNQICTTGNWNISPHGLWLDKQTLSDAGVLMRCCGSACFSFSPFYLFAVLLLISPALWKRIIKSRCTLLTGSVRTCFIALFCYRGGVATKEAVNRLEQMKGDCGAARAWNPPQAPKPPPPSP